MPTWCCCPQNAAGHGNFLASKYTPGHWGFTRTAGFSAACEASTCGVKSVRMNTNQSRLSRMAAHFCYNHAKLNRLAQDEQLHGEGSRPPAGDFASLGGVKEANVLAQEGVKQVGAYPEVQAGHAQSEQAATHPCEHCTPKRHPNQLQSGLLEHLAVRLYGRIVYDLASEVGHQGLPKSRCSPCADQNRCSCWCHRTKSELGTRVCADCVPPGIRRLDHCTSAMLTYQLTTHMCFTHEHTEQQQGLTCRRQMQT